MLILLVSLVILLAGMRYHNWERWFNKMQQEDSLNWNAILSSRRRQLFLKSNIYLLSLSLCLSKQLLGFIIYFWCYKANGRSFSLLATRLRLQTNFVAKVVFNFEGAARWDNVVVVSGSCCPSHWIPHDADSSSSLLFGLNRSWFIVTFPASKRLLWDASWNWNCNQNWWWSGRVIFNFAPKHRRRFNTQRKKLD